MLAFLFTLALFAYWMLIGLATLAVFPPRLRIIQGLLITPAVGVAVTLLPVFLINRAGIPVKNFGGMLLLFLFGLSLLILARKRPIFPLRRMLPFAGILVAGLSLVAGPMFKYGFDWVSFSNDDMANYCLGAQRFLNHGYFDIPNLKDLFSGRDYSQAYWFMHIAGGGRSGSELTLAFVWSATKLNAHQIFMPVILSLYLSLLCATGALVASLPFSKRTPLIAISLMAIFPLTSFGALYQLIGQVGGLTLLCSAFILFCRQQNLFPLGRLIKKNVVAGVILSGLFIWYPEVLPFLGISWFIFLGLKIRKSLGSVDISSLQSLRPAACPRDPEILSNAKTYCTQQLRSTSRGQGTGCRRFNCQQTLVNIKSIIIPSILICIISFMFIGSYLEAAIYLMLSQASGGLTPANLNSITFPYYLIPSGIPAFFGFVSIVPDVGEPYLSMLIVFSIVIVLWFLGRIMRQIREAHLAAIMSAMMIIMMVILFYGNNDFGLYKLAMFIQPFLIAVAAIDISGWTYRDHYIGWLALIVAVYSATITQEGYAIKSTGNFSGGFVEIPLASAEKINHKFDRLVSLIKDENKYLLSDTSNPVLAKFQSLYTKGKGLMLVFPANDFFNNIKWGFKIPRGLSDILRRSPGDYGSFISEMKKNKGVNQGEKKIRIGSNFNSFIAMAPLISTKQFIIGSENTIFNRVFYAKEKKSYYHLIRDPQNYLIFINSQMGRHYYLALDKTKVSFYQIEADPMFPEKFMTGLGSYLLFQIKGCTKQPRMMVEISSTIMKQFESSLPTVSVIGSKAALLPFVGRGGGRVISEPLEPAQIDGVDYVSLDLGREGKPFLRKTTGLMRLYGKDISLDFRRLAVFGRDISLISETDYHSIKAPSQLVNFPADLANKNLEYSGIYEDGWISERSFFMLEPKTDSTFLRLKGMIPLIVDPAFNTTLVVKVGDEVIVRKKLSIGEFDLELPVSNLQGRQRIDLAFEQYQRLPGDDGRITAGKMEFIGFREHA